MDFGDILGRLMPLFEERLRLGMEAQNRALTAAEKAEERKADLESRKLAAQIKSDEDKLAWEKEKAQLGFKHGMDLQTLANQGHIDLERLKQSGAKDVAQIQAAAAKYGHDIDAIPKLLAAGAGQVVKNADGSETTTPKSKEATAIGSRLAGNLGLTEPAKPAASQSQDAQKQAEIAEALSDYNTLKKTDPARAEAYLNSIKATAPELHAALAPAIGQAPAPAATPAGQQQAAPPTAAQQLAATSQPQRAPLNAGEALTMRGGEQPAPELSRPLVQPQQPMANEQITAAFARQGQQATPTLNEMMGLQARTQGTNPPASVGGMNMGGTIPQRPAMQPFQQAAIVEEEKKKKRSKLLNSTPSVL